MKISVNRTFSIHFQSKSRQLDWNVLLLSQVFFQNWDFYVTLFSFIWCFYFFSFWDFQRGLSDCYFFFFFLILQSQRKISGFKCILYRDYQQLTLIFKFLCKFYSEKASRKVFWVFRFSQNVYKIAKKKGKKDVREVSSNSSEQKSSKHWWRSFFSKASGF